MIRSQAAPITATPDKKTIAIVIGFGWLLPIEISPGPLFHWLSHHILFGAWTSAGTQELVRWYELHVLLSVLLNYPNQFPGWMSGRQHSPTEWPTGSHARPPSKFLCGDTQSTTFPFSLYMVSMSCPTYTSYCGTYPCVMLQLRTSAARMRN